MVESNGRLTTKGDYVPLPPEINAFMRGMIVCRNFITNTYLIHIETLSRGVTEDTPSWCVLLEIEIPRYTEAKLGTYLPMDEIHRQTMSKPLG